MRVEQDAWNNVENDCPISKKLALILKSVCRGVTIDSSSPATGRAFSLGMKKRLHEVARRMVAKGAKPQSHFCAGSRGAMAPLDRLMLGARALAAPNRLAQPAPRGRRSQNRSPVGRALAESAFVTASTLAPLFTSTPCFQSRPMVRGQRLPAPDYQLYNSPRMAAVKGQGNARHCHSDRTATPTRARSATSRGHACTRARLAWPAGRCLTGCGLSPQPPLKRSRQADRFARNVPP